MADEMLRLQLERDLERFKKAGMDDHAEKVTERLASLEADEDTGSGNFDDRTLPQLRAALKERDLPTSGNKAELVARLRGEG